ncbi:MAG: hypothetical protein Q8L48_12950 [Archangium sp.]|nr:hypothetical protein [Archangium sp.]
MKRALALFGCGFWLACGGLKLENYPRPFSCDHNGGDGGQQCAAGWACGFDDRCFDNTLDGGQLVETWRCEKNVHCPAGWKCGEQFEGISNCQELDAGAPTRCATDDGCQGGWRCAASHRCFDPADTDGGASRDCGRDGECPDGYRCGQKVENEQRCIQLGTGARSLCTSDEGCEGSYRCDTFANRCDDVTDVVTTGKTTALGTRWLNPRVTEPAPLLLAMNRMSLLPPAFLVMDAGPPQEGVMMAALLADGGLRVTAQFKEEQVAGPGPVTVLFERNYRPPMAAGGVTDLALSFEGPALRYANGATYRARFSGDGGWEPLGVTDFLRQRDPLQPRGTTALVRVDAARVVVDGDGGVGFPGTLREVVVNGDTIFALTDAGFFASTPGAGVPYPLPVAQPIVLAGRSSGAVAGLIGPLLTIIAEVPRAGGGTGFQAVSQRPLEWTSTPVLAACPDGGSPLQLVFDEGSDQEPMLLTRCAEGASSYPVQVSFGPMRVTWSASIEDQTPYQWSFVPQRASPFVRAHAGTDGRVWHALDRGVDSQLGRAPMRPVFLDRQPDTMLSFTEDRSGAVQVVAEAGGFIFKHEPNGGLVSGLAEVPLVLLSVIPTHSRWIVATAGLVDTSQGEPRAMATMPPGAAFTPPASGAAVQVGARTVVLVASGDTIWVADVTQAMTGPFAQPAAFERVLVPVPGVRLRSMTLVPSTTGISGFLTTSTDNLRFGTADLVTWTLTAVPKPPMLNSLPLEVWTEPDGGPGRTGFSDGRIWSLPIMVPLTQPLPQVDGGALAATDFARRCGDVFVATPAGVFRAEATAGPDGGLPAWVPVTVLNDALETKDALRLYETRDTTDRLFAGTRTGQVVELTATCLP